MVNFKLLTLALALVSGSAFAGYAQLAPPPGWSQGGSAASTFNFTKIAANDAVFTANTVRTTASLNVGGKLVKIPATMRLAANAGQFAARGSFGNPALFAALTIGSLAFAYYAESGFSVKDGVWQKTEKKLVCNGPCFLYVDTSGVTGMKGSIAEVGSAYAAYISNIYAKWDFVSCVDADWGKCSLKSGNSTQDFYIRKYPQPSSTSEKTVPVPQEEFERVLSPKPIPDGLPEKLPFPLPVEKPIINPSPDASPQPQPLRVPQGDPQPIPGTDPRQYRSPAIDIVPSPTATDPWRVDVQPKDIIKTDPTPLPETAPVPVPTPDAPADTTAPPTEQTDFCKANPDVLACAKPELDTPDEDQTPSKNKDISISPAGGFGSGGSCPSGKTLKAAGIQLSYQPVCDFMGAMRPVVIALAWLGAGLILLGLRGQTS